MDVKQGPFHSGKVKIKAFEMWCWRRMEKISLKDRQKTTDHDEEELMMKMIKENRFLMNIFQNTRKYNMKIWQQYGHRKKFRWKTWRGRSKISDMSQIKDKITVMMDEEVNDIYREKVEEIASLHRHKLCF